MPSKINTGKSSHKRTDLWLVDPYSVIVKEELRGRHKPPSPEDIMARALSMLEHGQLQPCLGRKLPSDKVQIIAGFTRTAAARLIRDGFVDADGVQHCDPGFLLSVTLVKCNDEEARERNVIENAHRNATSPIDDAINQEWMRSSRGYNNAEISRKYGWAPVKVGQHAKLLDLSDDVRLLVHDGRMAVSAALDYLDLPEEKRGEVLAAATNGEGKIKGRKVKDEVRDWHLRDSDETVAASEQPKDKSGGAADNSSTVTDSGEGGGKKGGGFKARTIANLRSWCREQEAREDQPEAVKTMATALLAYIDGKRGDKWLVEQVKSLASGS